MKVPSLTKWTIADLDQLPLDGNRYELIDGELFVAASPLEPHQRAQMRLSSKLHGFVEQHELGRVYTAPFDVHLTLPGAKGETRVEPDILFVSTDRLDIVHDWVYGAPDLVVEILSESTARTDRFDKRDAYRAGGVAEYWLVDPWRKAVTGHRFATGEPARELTGGALLTTPLLPGFQLPVDYIFR